MTDHIEQLFSRVGAAEALDPTLDYRLAAERKANPEHDELRLIGRVALLFTQTPEDARRVQDRFTAVANRWRQKISTLNERRKAEKQERKADKLQFERGGAIDQFDAIMQDQTQEAAPQYYPQPVASEPGLYRSSFADEQSQPEQTPQETDEIISQAVQRARRNLGALPIITMQAQARQQTASAPAPLGTDQPDAELITRLHQAYDAPAIPNEQRNAHQYTARHALAEEDDQITATAA